jgi:hypothetical protein
MDRFLLAIFLGKVAPGDERAMSSLKLEVSLCSKGITMMPLRFENGRYSFPIYDWLLLQEFRRQRTVETKTC